MDFELTDDQVALQEGMRAFLDGRFPLDVVRAIEAGRPPRPRPVARAGRDRRVLASRCPRPTAARARRVGGRARVRGARARARARPARRHLPRGAAGSTAPPPARPIVGRFEPGDARCRWSSTPPTSTRCFVLAADGVRRVDPAAIATRRRRTAGRRAHADARSSTATCPTGDADRRRGRRRACSPRRHRAHQRAAARPRARAPTELATAYAKEREQFGRVIGSFQAVKHLLRRHARARRGGARGGVRRRRCALDGRSDDDPVRAASVGEDPGRRRRPRQRQGGHPGARRDRVHVGGRRAALLEARQRARHPLRQQRRARRGRRRARSDPTPSRRLHDGHLRRARRHRDRRRARARPGPLARVRGRGRQGRRQRPRRVAHRRRHRRVARRRRSWTRSSPPAARRS